VSGMYVCNIQYSIGSIVFLMNEKSGWYKKTIA
jgi:hypothetical protein